MSFSVSQPRVIVEGISHSYQKDRKALDNINLDMGPGLFGLLGANGAGKSTLMQIISTLMVPSQGSISVAGYDVVSHRFQARQHIGYLPQHFGAWPSYTVEQALDVLASMSGIADSKHRKKRVVDTLESVGLSEVAKRKVKKLSGGMLRRLGIAQAIIHNPSVLIMDEPTVGLDPEERLRFRQLIAELSRDRVVILSTHIIADLGSTCSKLALIYEGKLEFMDVPESLVSQAKGKVKEVICSPEQLQVLDADDSFEIVSRTFEGDRSVLRGVSKRDMTVANAIEADNITLEEAYLAFTLSKGLKLPDAQALVNELDSI